MAERHYIGVYWEDRPATKHECAAQIIEMLERLRAHDPLFASWYVKRASREESLQTEATLEAVEQGLVLLSEDGPNLGWKVAVWNGLGAERSAQAELVLGAHPKILFSPTPNSCVLQMPRGRELPEVDALLRRERMTVLLSELARLWHADWGVVSTDSHLYSVMPRRPAHHPRVAWLTFLNKRRGRAPKVAKAHLTHVEDLGYVFGTHDDLFSSDAAGATERVLELEDALEAAQRLGVMGELPEVPEAAAPPSSRGTATGQVSHEGYAAALDVASAVDALSAGIPARRADLADALLRASTSLVVTVARGETSAAAVAEVRALLDVAERLFPAAAAGGLERARTALAGV